MKGCRKNEGRCAAGGAAPDPGAEQGPADAGAGDIAGGRPVRRQSRARVARERRFGHIQPPGTRPRARFLTNSRASRALVCCQGPDVASAKRPDPGLRANRRRSPRPRAPVRCFSCPPLLRKHTLVSLRARGAPCYTRVRRLQDEPLILKTDGPSETLAPLGASTMRQWRNLATSNVSRRPWGSSRTGNTSEGPNPRTALNGDSRMDVSRRQMWSTACAGTKSSNSAGFTGPPPETSGL